MAINFSSISRRYKRVYLRSGDTVERLLYEFSKQLRCYSLSIHIYLFGLITKQ